MTRRISFRDVGILVALTTLFVSLPPAVGGPADLAGSRTDTSAADFGAGVGDGVDLVTSPGDVLLHWDTVNWSKRATPVIDRGPPGAFDDAYVGDPAVLHNGTAYEMWYTGYDGSRGQIGHATSPDGLNWSKDAANPVLTFGAAGTWESQFVYNPTVVLVNGTYHMWYTGYNTVNARIGHATSSNGTAWTRDAANPVVGNGAAGSWEGTHVLNPSVIDDAGTYRMWYAGVGPGANTIGYATSADGTVWVKDAANPVLVAGAGGSWDDGGLQTPAVIADGDGYIMWFAGYDGSLWRSGVAESDDGVNWTKHLANPVLNVGLAGTFDDFGVYGPEVLAGSGGGRLWFSGNDGTGPRVGFASSGLLPEGTFTSRILDSGSTASTWVRVLFNATLPANASIEFRIRSGPTAIPDLSWSVWSPTMNVSGADPGVPRARYVQYRATLASADLVDLPILHDVEVEFLRNAAPSVSPTGPDPTVWQTVSSPTFSWSYTDREGDLQDIVHLQVASEPNFTAPVVDELLTGGGSDWTPPGIADGVWVWRIRAADVFGAWGSWSNGTRLAIDTTAPLLPTGLASVTHPKAIWSNRSQINVTWSPAVDATSGLAGYSIVWDSAANTFPDGVPELTGEATWALSPSKPDRAGYYVHIRTVDNAGLTSPTAAHLGPFWIDTTPPGAPTIMVASADRVTSRTSITVDIRVGGDISGIAGVSLSTDGVNWSDWSPPVGRFTVDLTGPEGGRTIRARLRDGAGNVGPSATSGVHLDTVAPVIDWIRVAGGAPAISTGRTVLEVNASDATSGLADMSLSIDGNAWQPWQVNRRTVGLVLADVDGPHEIKVRVRDVAGNIGLTASTTVVLDTVPPEDVALTVCDGITSVDSARVRLCVAGKDATTGITEMSFRETGGDWTPWETAADEKNWSLRAGFGRRTVEVRVRDAVENEAQGESITLTLGRLTIDSPGDRDRVTGVVTVRGVVTGGPASAVEVRVNGGTWQPARLDGATGWTFAWDTMALEDGLFQLEAHAVAGNEMMEAGPVDVIVEHPVEPVIVPPIPVEGPGLLLPLLLAIVLASVVAVLLLWNRRRRAASSPAAPSSPAQAAGAPPTSWMPPPPTTAPAAGYPGAPATQYLPPPPPGWTASGWPAPGSTWQSASPAQSPYRYQ